MLNLALDGGRKRHCDGLSRRDMLQIGTVGLFGLSLPRLLAAEQAARDEAARTGDSKRGQPRAKSVLLVFLGGGLSHHDSFDPKPDASEEIRGNYRPIDTCLAGVRFGELLPHMAQALKHVALVRSGAHNNDHHETATNWVLSGRFGSPFGDYPAMGAVVAHELGFAGTLPPYMAIPRNPSFTWELGKSAWLGGRYESFKTGDPKEADFRVPDVTLAQSLPSERIERRKSLLSAVDRLAKRIEANDQIATYDEFQQRAASMVVSSEARRALAIGEEPDATRDRYGRTTFGQSCLLARRVIEHGVRFVTINSGGWDHHSKIWDGLGRMLPDFDRAFSALIEDMHERGLLDETLVVVMGEFGRTPKINKDVGRDHWAPAASMIFAGAGVRPGQVIGATDKHGAEVTTRPIRPADVAYTIYESLGIDPRKALVDPTGRPIEILDEGESIRELFA